MCRRYPHLGILWRGAFVFAQHASPQFVKSWLTSVNGNDRFAGQSDKEFIDGTGSNNARITIDDTKEYQTIEGFGWTMTQGSAYWIMQMPQDKKIALLKELFSLKEGEGIIGSSTVRVALGASDLGQGAYTYQDDRNKAFSLAGPDLTYLVPVLQEMVKINPKIKLMASPWSAPAWMKTPFSQTGTQQLRGGSLKKEHFGDYADYILKYFQEMKKLGIEFHSMTIQNEPLTEHNWPSMYMSKEDQYNFVENYLGPKLEDNGFSHIKLIGYDHNCDNTEYPIYVARSKYIEGSAFHLYGGSIEALQTVYNQTKKSVYFTEQWSDGSSNGFNGGDFTWDMVNVMLGSVQNMSKVAIMWNVASNQNWDPHTDDGGCDRCKGAVTINSNTFVVTRNQTYYEAAHMSKAARDGAVRIASTSTDGGLNQVAFKNPEDESTSLVVFNTNGGSKTFDIVWNGKVCTYTLPGNTVATLVWAPLEIKVKVESVSLSSESTTIDLESDAKTFQLTATVLPENATLKTVKWSSSDNSVASVDARGLVKGRKAGVTTITVTTVNENKTATCEVTVVGVDPNPFNEVYNIVSVYSDKNLDVKDHNASPGAELQQWEDNGGESNQKWTLEKEGDDIYSIRSEFSLLNLQAMGNDDGAAIQLQPYSGAENQQWKIEEVESGIYSIISVSAGKSMDIDGPSNDNGRKLHLWGGYEGQANRQWKFVESEALGLTDLYSLSFSVYPNPVTDILRVDFDSQDNRTYEVYTVSGDKVDFGSLNNMTNEIDMTRLTSGVYVLKIQSKQNIAHAKVIKNK